uniref:Endonuclease/exonuclease/phosphatase domain-containing protein n=1 Tax=Timema monikensis TaxID=170555 RepID=A0A7R9HSE4_9NEOP|nr:unnamed protein product [Timema monikensis]
MEIKKDRKLKSYLAPLWVLDQACAHLKNVMFLQKNAFQARINLDGLGGKELASRPDIRGLKRNLGQIIDQLKSVAPSFEGKVNPSVPCQLWRVKDLESDYGRGPRCSQVAELEAHYRGKPPNTTLSRTSEVHAAHSFRVVSYNILADLYADSEVARTQLYPYCPSYALSIDYRKQLILRELLGIECCVVCSGYNADLICLQEVDSKIFDLDLTPVLGYVGYEGVFHRKGGTVSEGVACLFHKSKFRLLDTKSVVLAEELKTNSLFSDIWKKIEKNGALAERFLARTTCLQCTILESVEDPREQVIVGNTHLYFHPNADHIRLLQGGMTIIYLEDIFAKLLSMSTDKRVSMVVCGDFNSTPECGVYQLFTTQFVPENCIDWKSKEDEAMNELSLSHSLLLGSAYGTPAFTNFTAGFAGCLDYIFYQIDQLEITQV